MVQKPNMAAVELSRYLLGACGKIIAHGYGTTDIRSRLPCGYNLLLLIWYLLGVEMNLGHAHKTRFWYPSGVLEIFRRAPLSLL